VAARANIMIIINNHPIALVIVSKKLDTNNPRADPKRLVEMSKMLK
jgi:hypothetical protein